MTLIRRLLALFIRRTPRDEPFDLAPDPYLEELEVTDPDEGWWQPRDAKRYHYFVAGRSLCGRWGKYGPGGWEPEGGLAEEPGPDDCAPCWRKAKKRQAPR